MAAGQYQRGLMDISPHREAWSGFVIGVKLVSALAIVSLSLMAIFLT